MNTAPKQSRPSEMIEPSDYTVLDDISGDIANFAAPRVGAEQLTEEFAAAAAGTLEEQAVFFRSRLGLPYDAAVAANAVFPRRGRRIRAVQMPEQKSPAEQQKTQTACRCVIRPPRPTST